MAYKKMRKNKRHNKELRSKYGINTMKKERKEKRRGRKLLNFFKPSAE